MHKPKLVIGEKQGAVIAAAYANAACLEKVFETRNVQVAELPELSQAWGGVTGIIVNEPRLSKKGVQLEKLKEAVPEMFDRTSPWENRSVLAWKPTGAIMELMECALSDVIKQFGVLPMDTIREYLGDLLRGLV